MIWWLHIWCRYIMMCWTDDGNQTELLQQGLWKYKILIYWRMVTCSLCSVTLYCITLFGFCFVLAIVHLSIVLCSHHEKSCIRLRQRHFILLQFLHILQYEVIPLSFDLVNDHFLTPHQYKMKTVCIWHWMCWIMWMCVFYVLTHSLECNPYSCCPYLLTCIRHKWKYILF